MYAMSGILIIVPDIPVTLIFDQLILIHLNIQQMVSMCILSFCIGLDNLICVGKHPVTTKCAHIPLPLVTWVTSTNKLVRLDVCTMWEIGKMGNSI